MAYQPSFGRLGTPRRRNVTVDFQHKPINVSADTIGDIVQVQAAYRAGTMEDEEKGGLPAREQRSRNPLSFKRRATGVNMDLSDDGLRALATKDRKKQQIAHLKTVFGTLDENNDGFIDAKELAHRLQLLGYVPDPGEAQDIIWEVDDDCDGKVNWREFKSVYQRVRDDMKGIEPRRLFNVMEFMIFDIDNSGTIDLAEVMQLFYQRYGKQQLFSMQTDAKGVSRHYQDITFLEFVKHDQSFYRASRHLADAQRAKGFKIKPPPKGKLLVRRQNPGKLSARRRDTATEKTKLGGARRAARINMDAQMNHTGQIAALMAEPASSDEEEDESDGATSPLAPQPPRPGGNEQKAALKETLAMIKAGPRVRRPSKIIYVHYGLQT